LPEGLPVMEGLLKGIEHEIGPGRARHALEHRTRSRMR
jgi:hypothetical protein